MSHRSWYYRQLDHSLAAPEDDERTDSSLGDHDSFLKSDGALKAAS